jgi:PqqA peptide cyclase
LVERPYTLIAELTYRCPLACAYCSNPLTYAGRASLDTAAWRRIFREAEELGIVQLNLTGGEPLLRDDLEDLIAEARHLDLYVNLITSGLPLDRRRVERLRDCGLDSVQLSFQAAGRAEADRLAGDKAFDRKLQAAHWVREAGLPLTMNVVLHRQNLDQIEAVIALAERLEAQRLELANTQYLGWALYNRDALLPAREQLDNARAVAEAARRRLSGTMDIIFVTPDYYTDVPRACMDGWGRRFLVVTPDGLVLPCHAAHTIPDLPLEQAGTSSLRHIWEQSALFNLFRGESWMPAPCRTCDRRFIDHGGCRCQAFHLTGVAAATDPTCRWSPDHAVVQLARRSAARSASASILHPRRLNQSP